MSIWTAVECRKRAMLWKREGEIGDRYFVTADGADAVELPGREQGYPDPETAWVAYQQRRAIAREIDLNH